MEDTLKQILGKLDSLERGQTNIESDIQGLKSSQTEFGQGQTNIKSDIQSLKSSQTEFGQGQALLIKHVSDLEAGHIELRQNMARMEFDLTEKIQALSDGQHVMVDHQKATDKNIDFLVNTMDYVANKIDHVATDTSLLVGRVTMLENIAK